MATSKRLFSAIIGGHIATGSIEKRYRHKDGRTVYALINAGLVRDASGAPRYYAGQTTDITERHRERLEHAQLERQLLDAQKYESLGLLAGGLAHDFNNLLTTILGHASLARLKLPSDSPARNSLSLIEQATETASGLCRQLQAYAGGGPMVTKPLDLKSTVEATAELLRVSLGANTGLEICAESSLPAIVADPSQLRQLVMNLVINASDALGPRRGTIRVVAHRKHCEGEWLATAHAGRDLTPGEYVCLEVADDGPGMDQRLQTRVFDPYFSTKGQGRGLGLAAVLGIMRGLGGAVHLRSAPGKGTVFTLVFLAANAAYATGTTPPLPVGWRGSGKVLVVDDDNQVRPVIAAITERFGFTVVQAASGPEALTLFREHGPAIRLALLDITMPVMDGFETLAELRKLAPELNAIFISGYTEQDARQRFPDLHKMSFLPKPCTLNSLGSAIRNVLG
jgi:signal transduction histidine kinase/CheY-like chemotaxis protein